MDGPPEDINLREESDTRELREAFMIPMNPGIAHPPPTEFVLRYLPMLRASLGILVVGVVLRSCNDFLGALMEWCIVLIGFSTLKDARFIAQRMLLLSLATGCIVIFDIFELMEILTYPDGAWVYFFSPVCELKDPVTNQLLKTCSLLGVISNIGLVICLAMEMVLSILSWMMVRSFRSQLSQRMQAVLQGDFSFGGSGMFGFEASQGLEEMLQRDPRGPSGDPEMGGVQHFAGEPRSMNEGDEDDPNGFQPFQGEPSRIT